MTQYVYLAWAFNVGNDEIVGIYADLDSAQEAADAYCKKEWLDKDANIVEQYELKGHK
jgi:hypothetical protein